MTHNIVIWEAFQRLGTCRPQGFNQPGKIPWTAMNEYATRYEIEGADFDRLVHLVEVLDKVWLTHHAPKGKNGR